LAQENTATHHQQRLHSLCETCRSSSFLARQQRDPQFLQTLKHRSTLTWALGLMSKPCRKSPKLKASSAHQNTCNKNRRVLGQVIMTWQGALPILSTSSGRHKCKLSDRQREGLFNLLTNLPGTNNQSITRRLQNGNKRLGNSARKWQKRIDIKNNQLRSGPELKGPHGVETKFLHRPTTSHSGHLVVTRSKVEPHPTFCS
jgi:hypothetical protein